MPSLNPLGDCAEGYYGPLCTACKPGLSRQNKFECTLCPDLTLNIIRIAGIALVVLFVIVALVRSTMAGAAKSRIHSVYIKIFMNHVQLLIITAGIQLNWP
jgi:hypothetical protein